jgi:hypothetical protein
MDHEEQNLNQERSPSLPVRQMFVVQFRTGADVAKGNVMGRVEHIVSGQAALFSSTEELMVFFARMLSLQNHPKNMTHKGGVLDNT